MVNLEKRKFIGKRIEERRKQLGLSQGYLGEKLGVNQSTITRYEKGSIDNEKLLILNAISSVLHVSVEWLTGESEELTKDITDKNDIQIRDTMEEILKMLPAGMTTEVTDFSKELFLFLLKEYHSFHKSFSYANEHYLTAPGNSDLAKTLGFESQEEFNEILFLREITPSINAFSEVSDILRSYSKNPTVAATRMHNLLNDYIE